MVCGGDIPDTDESSSQRIVIGCDPDGADEFEKLRSFGRLS
jgi:hypothetical protein